MKILKWIGIVLGGLVGLVVIAVLVLVSITNSRLNKTYKIETSAIPFPTDEAALARGKHLAEAVIGCNECHGKQYEGYAFFEDPAVGIIYSANLTAGKGGVGASYNDADWVRTLRHGVKPDGKPVLVMPSNQFTHLSESDLAAILAYVRSQPAVDKESPKSKLTFMAQVLFALGAFGELPAEKIDHAAPFAAAPAEGPTKEYGGYLISIATCVDCHGENLAGQTSQAGPSGPNLTPGGDLGKWGEADFITALRTGVTPSGHNLSEEMPWQFYQNMTDVELQAIWAYLSSLPTLPTNTVK